MINISMVITVYNGEKYIEETLQKICNQGEKNIEVIVVDDASQDASCDIVRKIQKNDNRVILIEHAGNKGTHASRKDGIAVSTGKYVMFCDQDDQYIDGAFETLLKEIENQQVDVLQYGVKVVNSGSLDEKAKKEKDKYYTPYTEKRLEGDLTRSRWEDDKFSINIWNKIFDGDICRRAFEESSSEFICYHEDYYENFLILYEANSYVGIDEKLYVHYFGRGTTGHQEMSLDKFSLIASGAKVSLLVEQFLQSKGDNQHADIVEIIEKETILGCFDHLTKFVSKANQQNALDMLSNNTEGSMLLKVLLNENNRLKLKLKKQNKKLKKIQKSKSYIFSRMITKPMRAIKK